MAFDMQSPAPCQDLAITELLLGSSCLCPQLHIIPAWQGWRINDDAAKSFPEVKAKKQQCWHSSGAWGTSRGYQLAGDYTVVCSFPKLPGSHPGYQAGLILAIKRLKGGQGEFNDGGAVLGTPEPCHVLEDAEEKRGFICTSSMPSASSRLAKQMDETAFSGWIRGRFGRICL